MLGHMDHRAKFLAAFLLAGLLGNGLTAAEMPLEAPAHDPTVGVAVLARQFQQEKTAYQQLVTRAEAGSKDIDFDQLRRTYFAEGNFRRVWEVREGMEALRQDIRYAANANNMEKTRNAARLILTVKYIDIQAHKHLANACMAPGWETCVSHHNAMYLGLLNSVVKTGDGKTCATAWKVLSVDDQNAVLDTLNVKPVRHEYVVMNDRQCDEIRAADADGAERNYYFDVAEVPKEERAAFKLQ